jgi:hypothetical protein
MFDISAYSLFFYGSANDIIILPISDAGMIFDGATTTYRLVNLTIDEGLSLGLVSTEPTDPSLPASGNPLTIPLGSTFIINATRSGTYSFQSPAFYGLRDLLVVDTRSNTEVYRIRSYNFEQGAHYDVVVTQLPAQFTTLRVELIKYPRN